MFTALYGIFKHSLAFCQTNMNNLTSFLCYSGAEPVPIKLNEISMGRKNDMEFTTVRNRQMADLCCL